MQPSSYVNWVASLNIDEAFVLLVAPVGIVAGIGALVFRALFGRFIGTAGHLRNVGLNEACTL